MQTLEFKKRILAYLADADDRVLKIVNSVFEKYYNEEKEVVAFYPDGSPMTKKQYKAALDIAEEQILKGDFISVEEFEREES